MKSPLAYWRNKKKRYQYLDKVGWLVSFTKINHPPEGFGNSPYWVGMVEFKNKKKTTGQLVLEGKKPKTGAKVRGIIRRLGLTDEQGIINYGVKFKLI